MNLNNNYIPSITNKKPQRIDRSDFWWTGLNFQSEVIIHDGEKIEFCSSVKVHLKWIIVFVPSAGFFPDTRVNLTIRSGSLNKAMNLTGEIVQVENGASCSAYIIHFDAINYDIVELIRNLDDNDFIAECQSMYSDLKAVLDVEPEG